MKNIAPGLSLKKYKGNKHEQGGIMVNALGNKTKDINKAVAEVEGGEYNYRYDPTNPNNNYILSAQLVEPAKIAEQADTFKNNDRISYNTRTNLLNKSVKLNEVLKPQQEQSQMQMQQAALGGMLKKYKNGSFLLKGSQSIIDSMVANSKQNDTTQIATAPEIKLGKTTAPKLETNPIALPTLPTTTPKTTAEAANTGMQVNTKNEATPEPVIEKNKKNNFKGALSAVSGAVSALGPIGQGVGAAMQLAPYAIDLGKAMFDKTSVQDLQTQGSAMKLPNTTYAKNGGKLNVKSLPKFDDGGKPKTRTPKSFKNIGEFSDSLSEEQMKLIKDNPEQFNKDMMNWSKKSTTPVITPTIVPVTTPTTSNVTNTKPLKIKTKLEIDKKALAGDKSYLDKKFTTQNYIDYFQEKADEISRTNAGVTDKMYRSLSKFFNTPADFDPYFKSNPLNVKPNSLNFTSTNNNPLPVTNNQSNLNTNPLEIKLGKPIQSTYGFDDAPLTDRTKLITNPLDLNLNKLTEQDYINNPKLTKPLNLTKLPTTTPKTVSEAVNLGLKLNTQTNSTPEPIIETPKPSKEVKSLSEQLYNRGQNKQKLSEALMYGMAALPSEQIKTITPDYGRGDDAMSRMGLSTEPIRQEMMQGANKALELTRSQVGTAGQLQSRGQSIMSNLSSQLSQSQIQQQQYLNQLRGALAQREDIKSNVLAQSELTAREAKSAERAAKLDQLNNAISQTSAIGAGTMEQASKMSTIENENERFKRNQDFIRELANQGVAFEVDENGKIVFNNKVGNSNIQTPSLATNPQSSTNVTTGTGTPPPSSTTSVAPATTTGDTYTVKGGDSLYRIAVNNNMNLNQLLKLNPTMTAKSLIRAGDKLKIK